MFRKLPSPLKIFFTLLIYSVSLVVLATIFLTISLIRYIVPWGRWRAFWYPPLVWLWEIYCSLFPVLISMFTETQWDVQGDSEFSKDDWYLMICNHVTATDIVVLQALFNRKIPLLKFFIKKELLWFPFAGWACWIMDFPFMARHSREALKKNPNLRGQDFETTKRKCLQFRQMPTSIINFVEGTRFTEAKKARQASPYQHLLKPKAGGVALALAILEGQVKTIIDVTLVYPGGGGLMQFMAGKVPKVIVRIEKIPVSEALIGNYYDDLEYRKRFQQWLNSRWQKKDVQIQELSK